MAAEAFILKRLVTMLLGFVADGGDYRESMGYAPI